MNATTNASEKVEPGSGVNTDKKGFARRWCRGTRAVQDWLSQGLPHMRLGHRSVVINIDEGDKWVMNRFRVRRFPKKGQQQL